MNAPAAEGASWEDFAEDIMENGEGICHRSAVEILAREARGLALELDAWGVPFTRMPSGRWASRTLPGSSKPWTLFAGDLTGHMLLQVLYERFLESQAAAYDEAVVVTLAMDDNGCHGAVAFDLRTGRLFPVAAKAVVLATGSMGRLYRRTTASLSCTGDGVALAYRAGAELRDVELVQFHPTVLAGTGVVVSDMALAEGAKLVISGELLQRGGAVLTRAALARRIEEAASGQADGSGSLDLSHMGADWVVQTMPHTRQVIHDLRGLDISREPVPVRPAVHRFIGGVLTDTDGATSIAGLYAAGECASTGVHGAGILAGNTLTEAVVFGKRAGAAAARHAQSTAERDVPQALITKAERRLAGSPSDRTGSEWPRLRRELQHLMDKDVGLVRDGLGLGRAQQRVAELEAVLARSGPTHTSGPFNQDALGYLETGFLADCAEAVIASALARTESRGVHFRADHAAHDDERWLRHVVTTAAADGPRVETRAVAETVTQPPLRSC